LRHANSNTLVLQGGIAIASIDDPGIVLDVPSGVLQQLDIGSELEVEGIWQLMANRITT
jgi:hypothetical protein